MAVSKILGNTGQDKRIRQLERRVGRLTIEKEILGNRRDPTPEEINELIKMGYSLTVISSALGINGSTY